MEYLIGAYCGGFICTAMAVSGGAGNKLGTAAIWPFWLAWSLLTG